MAIAICGAGGLADESLDALDSWVGEKHQFLRPESLLIHWLLSGMLCYLAYEKGSFQNHFSPWEFPLANGDISDIFIMAVAGAFVLRLSAVLAVSLPGSAQGA